MPPILLLGGTLQFNLDFSRTLVPQVCTGCTLRTVTNKFALFFRKNAMYTLDSQTSQFFTAQTMITKDICI